MFHIKKCITCEKLFPFFSPLLQNATAFREDDKCTSLFTQMCSLCVYFANNTLLLLQSTHFM